MIIFIAIDKAIKRDAFKQHKVPMTAGNKEKRSFNLIEYDLLAYSSSAHYTNSRIMIAMKMSKNSNIWAVEPMIKIRRVFCILR